MSLTLAQLQKELSKHAQETAAAFEKEWIINYPANSTYPAASGVGTNTFDFKKPDKGITLYDGTIESFHDTLTSLDFPFLRTLAVASDVLCQINFWRKGQKTQTVMVDQFWALAGAIIPFDKLTLNFDYPGIYLFVGTTSEREWRTFGLASRVQRQASGVTGSSLTGVNWQALVAAGILSDSGAAYTNANLYVPNCYNKAAYVFNEGTAAMDVNLQGSVDGLLWVDDQVTGASLQVGAGDNAALPTTNPYQFMRLRVKSSSAVPTAYATYFLGRSN